MPTVAQVVKKLVREKPFLTEGLRRGIISHAGLAEELIPDVQKELEKDVTFSAVNMAIRRLSEKLGSEKAENVLLDMKSDITVRSQLATITLHKTTKTQEHIRKLYTAVDMQQGDFLTVTQGQHEVMVVTNERHMKNIRASIPEEELKNVSENLSIISLIIPERAASEVGMFYTITRALAWEGINVVDIVSTYTELTILVNEKQTGRAFDTLRKIIDPSQD